MSKYPPIGLDDRLRFGKYGPQNGKPGKPLWEVLEIDPNYVAWLIENTDTTLTNDAFAAYQKQIARLS